MRRTVVLTLGALGAALLVPVAVPGAAVAVAPCTRYWTGETIDLAWSDPANWSATDGGPDASVPTAADVVCMSTAPTSADAVVSDDRSVAGITFPAAGSVQPRITVTSGASLTVDTHDSVVRTLTLSDGSLFGGQAAVTVGDLGDVGDTQLSGSGSLTLAAGGTATVPLELEVRNGYEFVNQGTVLLNGALFAELGGQVTNAGTWTVGSPAPFEAIVADPFTNAAGGSLVFEGSTDLISGAIVNDGTLTVASGVLHLTEGSDLTGSGDYVLEDGTFLELAGASLDLDGGTVSGPGLLRVPNGSITGTGTATNVELRIARLNGPGTLTLAPGGTSRTAAGAPVTLSDTFRLVNRGSFTQLGRVVLEDQATVENEGTWNLANNAQVTHEGGASVEAFLNRPDGVLVATPKVGKDADLSAVGLRNEGRIEARSGTTGVSLTNLEPDGTVAGGTMTGGNLTVDGGTLELEASLQVNDGVVALLDGALVDAVTGTDALAALRTNNGNMRLAESVDVSGDVTNTGRLRLSGGTLGLTSYTQTGPASSTQIDAPAVLRSGPAGTGPVDIDGGTLSGDGRVEGDLSQTAPATFQATVDAGGHSTLTVTGAAQLAGTLAIQTGAGVDPSVGTSLRILQAASRTGTFATVTGLDALPNGKTWSVVYDATGVSLVVVGPAVSVAPVAVTEGNSGTTPMTFTVALGAPSLSTLTFGYTTVDQSAVAPGDYTAASGTLTFPPGTTSRTVAVAVRGDTTDEPDETLLLRVTDPGPGSVVATGTGTVVDDDAAPLPPVVPPVAAAPALKAKATVRGSVVVLHGRLRAAGAPVAGARLRVTEAGERIARVETRPNGRWSVRLRGLGDGRHVLKVRFPGTALVEARTVRVVVRL